MLWAEHSHKVVQLRQFSSGAILLINLAFLGDKTIVCLELKPSLAQLNLNKKARVEPVELPTIVAANLIISTVYKLICLFAIR